MDEIVRERHAIDEESDIGPAEVGIQEYTGFVSPGIFAMFILGFFWKKATSNAAIFATIGGFVFSVIFKFLPLVTNLSWLAPLHFAVPVTKEDGSTYYDIPFLDRMGFVFIIAVLGMVIISNIETRKGVTPHGMIVDKKMFGMSPSFAVGALLVCGVLVALYSVYW